jgi:hypothetical protein
VNPSKLDLQEEQRVYLRSLIVKYDAAVELRLDNRIIKTIKKGHVQPSEMIHLTITPQEVEGTAPDSALEFSIQ